MTCGYISTFLCNIILHVFFLFSTCVFIYTWIYLPVFYVNLRSFVWIKTSLLLYKHNTCKRIYGGNCGTHLQFETYLLIFSWSCQITAQICVVSINNDPLIQQQPMILWSSSSQCFQQRILSVAVCWDTSSRGW